MMMSELRLTVIFIVNLSANDFLHLSSEKSEKCPRWCVQRPCFIWKAADPHIVAASNRECLLFILLGLNSAHSIIYNVVFLSQQVEHDQRLNLTDADTPAWICPPPLPAPDSSCPSCESMRPSDPDPSPDPQNPEAQLDFFHKLGYSTAQVQAVQQQFGPNTDTDKVLGELVRIGVSREAKQGPVTTMSVLVPRGDIHAVGPTMLLPLPSSSSSSSCDQTREESGEDEDALRPVVIDGSNVAMRWETADWSDASLLINVKPQINRCYYLKTAFLCFIVLLLKWFELISNCFSLLRLLISYNIFYPIFLTLYLKFLTFFLSHKYVFSSPIYVIFLILISFYLVFMTFRVVIMTIHLLFIPFFLHLYVSTSERFADFLSHTWS